MHGRILETAYRANSLVTHSPFGELDTGLSFMTVFHSLKVTHLSASTVSLVAIGEEGYEGNGAAVLVRGAAVDIAQGNIFTINSCREERRRPFFTFGPLLTICDDGKLAALRSVWREQSAIVQKHAHVPPGQDDLQEDCRALVSANIDNATFFSLYLTPAGLAVHNAFSIGAWENACYTDSKSHIFPVVIPWSRLAPIMNPGPLRDELLAGQ